MVRHLEADWEEGDPGYGWAYKGIREKSFPVSALARGLSAKLEEGSASNEADKNHILNYIAKNLSGFDGPPPVSSENYELLNKELHSFWAQLSWSKYLA